jgi:hypothetical protein
VLDPTLQSLFHGDMREHGRKLMAMLHMIVAGRVGWRSWSPAFSCWACGIWAEQESGEKPGIAAVTTTAMEGRT